MEAQEGRAFTLKDGRIGLVRRARMEDASVLMANVNSVAEEKVYIARDDPITDLAAEEDWVRGFDGVRRALYVAEVDGRVVGSADVRSNPSRKESHARSLGIVVIKHYRGLGVGRALMQGCIEFCRREGAEKVCLEVFSTNAAAIALYRKLGFRVEGRRRGQFKIRGRYVDEVQMALWLRPPKPPPRRPRGGGNTRD